MNKITLNGKHYIALGDFDALRRNLVNDIYERYEKDEDGKIHLSDVDIGRVDAYTHIMTEIMLDEIHAAESPDEIRKMHADLRHEWLDGKYVIVGEDDGTKVYYRKRCACGENGEEQPVFTSVKRYAKAFDDHFIATNHAISLSEETGTELEVVPLSFVMMSDAEAKKLLDAIFRDDDEEEYHGDGTRAEDEDWDDGE